MAPLIAGWMMLFAADVTELHRCVGDDGVPRYQDQPCASGESQQHLRLISATAGSAGSRECRPGEPQLCRTDSAAARKASAPPEPFSWRCEVDNGEVYYRHDGCPDVLSEPLWLSMPDRSGYSTWMQVVGP